MGGPSPATVDKVVGDSDFALVRSYESADQSVSPLKTIKAVSRPAPVAILFSLKDPAANVLPHNDGDLIRDEVCADLIREVGDCGSGVTAPDQADRRRTADRNAHEGGNFYRRDEPAIQRLTGRLKSDPGRRIS